MYLSVIAVRPLDDYKMEIVFENNEKKIFDVAPYLDMGVFAKLKDKNLFSQVKVSYDTVEWPEGIDLDPEVLYQNGYMAGS